MRVMFYVAVILLPALGCSDESFVSGPASGNSSNTLNDGDVKGSGNEKLPDGIVDGSETGNGPASANEVDGPRPYDTGSNNVENNGNSVNSGNEGNSSKTAGDSPLGPDEVQTPCDLENDFVEFEYPERIQNCIDDNRVWNFYSDTCSPIEQAQTFDCTWDGVKEAAKNLGVGTIFIEQAQADNAKLVGCGENTDRTTFVFQSFVPPDTETAECQYNGSQLIWIGCGRQFEDREAASEWQNLGNIDKVKDCLVP